MKFNKLACCSGLLLAASTCVAQMYTVTDLGTLGGTYSGAAAIDASGQVVGDSYLPGDTQFHAFRTAANRPIDSATDDLATFGGPYSLGWDINDSGQAVGQFLPSGSNHWHAFRTAANGSITDDLSSGLESIAMGINASGQVVGEFVKPSGICCDWRVFRTAPNSPINPATDDLGGGLFSEAFGINASGQVVGSFYLDGFMGEHAFRTAPNSPINPATDDLGTFSGGTSIGRGINAYGQVVGSSYNHAFLYDGGVMYDLNDLIPAGSGWNVADASDINDAGQISGTGRLGGQGRAVLLTPVYKASVQQPVNADGSSVFSAKRGVLPVKFTLSQYNVPSCSLLPATMTLTRTASGRLGQVSSGSNFRITGCQYHYNLATRSAGVGTYRVDISINGIMVGHAVFALE